MLPKSIFNVRGTSLRAEYLFLKKKTKTKNPVCFIIKGKIRDGNFGCRIYVTCLWCQEKCKICGQMWGQLDRDCLMQEIRISSSLISLDVRLDLLSHLGLWLDPAQVATVTWVFFRPSVCRVSCWEELMVSVTLGISEPTPRVSLFKNRNNIGNSLQGNIQ